MCDRPVSIISGFVAGINSIPLKLTNQRWHMNSGLLPFIGEFQKKFFLKDCKKCINMVKLLLQNPIWKELLSNADYLVSWKMTCISAPNKTCFTIISKTWNAGFCRWFSALLVFHFNKVEKKSSAIVLWFYFLRVKKV